MSRKLAGWIDDFITGFSNNNSMPLEKEAELDVEKLPKVIWEDNTFYVNLDKNTKVANVINEYGNVVTTLLDVETLDDVNEKLNKSVVTASDKLSEADKKMYDELSKIADAMESTDLMNAAEEHTQEVNEQSEIIRDNNSTEQQQTNVLPMDQSMDNAMENASEASTDFKRVVAKLDECLNKIDTVFIRLAAIEDQIHAYTDPGNIYDLNAEQREREHYTENMHKGETKLEIEHQLNLTNPVERGMMPEMKKIVDKVYQDMHTVNGEDIIMVDEPLPEPDEVMIIKTDEPLTDKDTEIFKTQVCPICANKSLRLSTKTASAQKVVCDSCKTKYSVDLETEKITKLK